MTTLKDGEWIWRGIESQWREKTPVFTGSWEKRKRVGEVNRYQAMALSRWHSEGGLFYMVKDGNGRQIDIYVAGDIEAFYGDGDE